MMAPLRPLVASVLVVAAAACESDVDVATGGGGSGGNAQPNASAAEGPGGTTSAKGPASSTGTGTPTSGTESVGTTGPGGSTATGSMICPGQTPCQDCVSTSCPDVWCACVQDPGCAALFQCTSQCSDQACNQMCMQTYPDSISTAVLVADCAADPCAMDCPAAGDPLSPCQECLYTSCADEMNTCLSTPDCSGLWTCFADCAQFDLTCQQACYDAYPTGAEPLEQLFACADAPCGDVCN